jgi:hypothetical protein
VNQSFANGTTPDGTKVVDPAASLPMPVWLIVLIIILTLGTVGGLGFLVWKVYKKNTFNRQSVISFLGGTKNSIESSVQKYPSPAASPPSSYGSSSRGSRGSRGSGRVQRTRQDNASNASSAYYGTGFSASSYSTGTTSSSRPSVGAGRGFTPKPRTGSSLGASARRDRFGNQ